MPGMGSGLGATNSTIVSAFKTALLHQGAIVLLVLALVGVAWNLLRAAQLRRAIAAGGPADPAAAAAAAGETGAVAAVGAAGRGEVVEPLAASPFLTPEPPARRLLRIAFGLIWIFDGLLQAQVAMPLGMPSQVIEPTASSSPPWVQHLVEGGTRIWTHHPVTAAAATVWIQVGIGLFLLVAPRGMWSRLAGLGSLAWGLVVWVFGESFGGIFAPGLSWMFGAPGAVLFYCLAGGLVALPDRAFVGPRLGKLLLRVMGVLFLGMALLQAWPGRGFWQGRLPGHSLADGGPLVSMIVSMATTPQPAFLSGWLGAFARFDAAHGFAVNLVVVVALAAIGAALCTARPAIVRWAVAAGVLLCLADWVLVQDFGFFGGVGTDPNSMVPMALVLVAGYVALVRAPAQVTVPTELPARSLAERARRVRLRLGAYPGYALRTFAGLGAVVVVLVGVVPMALASANPVADPILTQAVDGNAANLDQPAPPFRLVDQHGQVITLASLRAKAVALTFLDPVCTSDCPLIAHELRQADTLLGSDASRVDIVAIVANPIYRSTAYTLAFTRAEGLGGVRNWLYLTGSAAALQRAWNDYGIQVGVVGGGAMVAHNDAAYVIGPDGKERYYIDSDPGDGAAATQSSFAGVIAGELRSVLAR